jgi:hypothetical protein
MELDCDVNLDPRLLMLAGRRHSWSKRLRHHPRRLDVCLPDAFEGGLDSLPRLTNTCASADTDKGVTCVGDSSQRLLPLSPWR